MLDMSLDVMYHKSVLNDTGEGGLSVDAIRLDYEIKRYGKTEFTQGEIQKIVDVLGLDTPMGIFLQRKCPKENEMKGALNERPRPYRAQRPASDYHRTAGSGGRCLKPGWARKEKTK